MRIIGGTHRGRKLDAPSGLSTRPMLDRVREALFSKLAPELKGALVLDLFAGTGSLGLETLSRGAARARLIESDPAALRALRANVAELELAEQADVVRADALDRTHWTFGEGRPRIVFFDPPYGLLEHLRVRRVLFTAVRALVTETIEPDGVLVFHAPRQVLRGYEFGPGIALEERVYGTSALWFARRAPATAGDATAGDEVAADDDGTADDSEDGLEGDPQ